jgi:hypothetical protein
MTFGEGDYVRCSACKAVELVPLGAEECPTCGEIGTLSDADEYRTKTLSNLFKDVFGYETK